MHKLSNGEILTDSELANKAKISIHAVKARIKSGETPDQIYQTQKSKRATRLEKLDRCKGKDQERRRRNKQRQKKEG